MAPFLDCVCFIDYARYYTSLLYRGLCKRYVPAYSGRSAYDDGRVICIKYRILIRQPREFGEALSGRRFVQAQLGGMLAYFLTYAYRQVVRI